MHVNRLHSIVLLMLLLFLCLVSPTKQGQAQEISAYVSLDQLVQDMLNQVDPDRIYTYTGDISGAWEVTIAGQPYTISTRHALSGEPVEKAAQYLFEFYENLGLQVEYQPFSFQGQTLSNVVAQKEGSVFPERVFLITSHYDDVPVDGPAPGADDNASGTVGVMIAAEILSKYDFGCTLRFVNFGAEEYGMIGSQEYAYQAYCDEEDIQGVLNLDMIAWNSPGSATGMELHSLSSIQGSDEIATTFQNVVTDYSLDLIPALADPITTQSDHSSFWKYNYPAILVSEDWTDRNPNYHSINDDLESLEDLNYYTSMVKASIGTLAHMGCLVEAGWGQISGQVVDAKTNMPLPGATLQLHNQEWGYTWTTQSDENGSYQFSAPSGPHILSADDIGYAYQEVDAFFLQNQTQVKDFEIEAAEEITLFIPLFANTKKPPPEGCQ